MKMTKSFFSRCDFGDCGFGPDSGHQWHGRRWSSSRQQYRYREPEQQQQQRQRTTAGKLEPATGNIDF